MPSASDAANARPLRADAARNRVRILEAANEAFAAEGLGVPVDVIAERAGVGVGTVYRHFPTKEALGAAILTTKVEGLIAEADRLADGADDPAGALEEYLAAILTEGTACSALAGAFSEEGYDLKAAAPNLEPQFTAALARLLGRAQTAGVVRPEVRAEDLLALIAAACMVTGRPDRDAESGRRLLAVVTAGLRSPTATT
jgi:AcrR family transcriptional regulator